MAAEYYQTPIYLRAFSTQLILDNTIKSNAVHVSCVGEKYCKH